MRRCRFLGLPTVAPLLLLVAGLVAPAPAFSPPGAGGQVVRYDGVAVRVPAGWPVYDLTGDPTRCVRFDVHAVYLGAPGADQRCPAHLVGRTESVLVAPGEGQRPSVDAAVAGDYTRVLDGGRVRVTAAFGARPDVARSITASATVTAMPAPAVTPAALAAPRATPAASTGSTFIGNGFDTCAAPAESAMRTWITSSPYRAANIYIGGAMRGCAQPNLSATWVSDVQAMGWRLIPTYVGVQAPCTPFTGRMSADPTTASTQGQQAADDAVTQAQSLGLAAGSPVYFDMENYNRAATGCSAAVLAFLGAWTQELHAKGFSSGSYGSGSSLVADLSSQWGTSYPEPDDLWFANWNSLDSEYGDPYVPDSQWTGHRRIHQWHGGATETYGGVSINVDGDGVDAQVAGPPGGDCVVFAAEQYGPDGCDGAFTLTGPLQYWRFGSPYGQQHSMRWTYGNGASESNGATWAPQLTAGVYDLSVWVPNVHSGATAHYTVTDANGSHSVTVDQSATRGTWASLGEYTTGVSGAITAHVGDDTSTSSVVGVDAMTFHFVHAIDQQPPTGTLTTPAAGSFAHPGGAVTLAGTFTDDVYVTKVEFSVADTSGDWHVVGTDVHNGNGLFRVTWPESYPQGAVVSVRADVYDTAGHVTTETATNVLTIDATPPTAVMTQPVAVATTATSVRLAWQGADAESGVSAYDLRGQWSTPSGWTSAWHRVGPAAGFARASAMYGGLRMGWQYCFEVRAHDRAGNVSPWSARRCVARALDDTALAAVTSGWWRPHHRRSFFGSTFTSTTVAGAMLSRRAVSATGVALLATTCPHCGAVRVTIGARYVGTVNLRGPWQSRRWVMLRAFSRRAGALVLRSVTGGRLVRIDAFVVTRA